MDIYTIIGYVGAAFGALVLLVCIGALVFAVWFMITWDKQKKERQTNAEMQRSRHSGRTVLEWNGPRPDGAADPDFGPLLVELPKKGGGYARFYEQGLLLDGKRISYDDLKDVFYDAGSEEKARDLKNAIQNSAVLWLYRKRGHTIGLRDFQYAFDDATMLRIQRGLGCYVHS